MAQHRHKRETNARRLSPFRARAITIAAPLALVATGSVVGVGVLNAAPTTPARYTASEADPAAADLGERTDSQLSRGATRIDRAPSAFEKMMSRRAVALAIKQADRQLWTTATLNLWDQPGKDGKKLGELPEGKKVPVTGRKFGNRVEIVVNNKARWVTAGYLSKDKPFALGGACTNGTSVPAGVSDGIKRIHQAVCAAFPEITVYGTGGGDSAEAAGLEMDIMVSGARGWQVAELIRANAAAFGLNYVIYSQRIWSVERSGEGWRPMASRGSVTQNHYDHVHVTTY